MNNTTSVQNPFITGQPARGRDFVGRVRLLNRIRRFIDDPGQTNFAVIGKRRSGKTSLLKKVQDSYRSDELLILYFNMQKFIDSPLSSLLSDIKRRLMRYSDLPEHIAQKKNFEEFLATAFNYPVRRILLLFDEFDVVCKSTEEDPPGSVTTEFANYWRILTKYTEDMNIPLKNIFASSKDFLYTESPCCHRLLKSCSKGTLTPLHKSAVYRILGMGDLQFRNENVLEQFYKLTAGNPYFTQVLAHTLYETAEVQAGEKIGLRILWRSARNALKAFGYGAAVIWGELEAYEQIILYTAARMLRNDKIVNIENMYNELYGTKFSLSQKDIQRNFNKLQKENFLQSDTQGNFWYRSEFFREWVQRSIKKSALSKQISQ